MRKTPVLALLMATAGLALLAASASARSSAAAKGGTLRYNHTLSDYEYIDAQKCYDTGCAEMLWPTSFNLMQYPEKNGAEGKRVYPEAAAAAPTVSKDGKTYTFTVRKGSKASNGKTVTPQWFVHAFERVLSPKMGDTASARFGAQQILGPVLVGAQEFSDGKAERIAGLSVAGDKLVIKLKKAFPSLVSVLAMNWFTATDPALGYSEQDAVAPVPAAGPYFISSREPGRTVVLSRNPNYKGTRPANADQIVISVGGAQATSVLQVKSGQADIDTIIPSEAAAELGDTYGVNRKQFWVKPTLSTNFWALSTLPGSPFASVKLRQAVNWAIDRPAQVRIAGKYGGRRTDQILPPAMPGFKQNNNLYAYKGADVAKAKAVAGDVAGLPEVRILHSNSLANQNRGQVMRYNLEQIGLKAKTEGVPFAQLVARYGDKKRGNYDMVWAGWQADYPDPENFLNVLLDGRNIPDEGASNNQAYFNSAKFNKLMDEAAKLSGDVRYSTYGALDLQIMKEAAPWAPVLNGNNRVLVSSRISSFTYNDANTYVALNALVVG